VNSVVAATSGSKSNEPADIVVCRQVTRDYLQGQTVVHALRGVDLDVLAGELTLLVGPSGCGKTTLLTIIAGMLETNSGDVTVLEHELSRLSRAAQTRFRSRHIGFVFQQYNLLGALTAAENVAVPLIVAGLSWDAALAQARTVLAKMGLEQQGDTVPTKLSGGQQQRVAIARALVHEPQLIVCDEPTAALDAATGHRVMSLLKESAVQPGRAVLVVTHDPRVLPFADRIAYMEDGRVTRVETQASGAPIPHIIAGKS
jgi:putative ABC transport system ATP-binding protein